MIHAGGVIVHIYAPKKVFVIASLQLVANARRDVHQ